MVSLDEIMHPRETRFVVRRSAPSISAFQSKLIALETTDSVRM